MNCPSCGHENPATNRFCGGCGAALARVCPSCAHANTPDHRFCGACGASLIAPPAEKAEVRKVVTIVFADLIGSTALHERLDPESVSRLMDRYHRTVRAQIEAHGGSVVQLLGDGVMCAFGVPHVAEDDAIRAVRAAVAVQQAFREFARAEREVAGNVGLRVAVNTGEVVASDEYAAGIGDPLNVAARLQQEARDGDVLIGESTQRLVRELVTLEPLGVFALKGRAETVAAYRVVSLDRPAGVAATPFVGREAELRRVLAVYEAAVANRRARLAVILGSPGLGKSRLVDEVARRLGDAAAVLTAHCEAAGGATFAPIAKALRSYLRIEEGAGSDAVRAAVVAAMPGDDAAARAEEAATPGNDGPAPRDGADRARIADGIAALLAGMPASPEETFFVIRRFLAALAAARPVVLAIDDLHWAEPLLLDLAEHLIQWSTDVPLLVLAAARPELRETRSSLTTPGGLVADVVALAGLDAGAATRLAANVIGAELPAAVAGRVLATSEGNPLFVGELVRMLVADGALKREGDRWTTGVELTKLEMPPTIQALLAARIERLRPEERTVLERAAVVGRQFSRAAVTHLLPREIADLDARLEALRRSELIEPDTAWFLGEPALRFHHVLVRDAAYRRLLKNTRAELHARFADWLETRVGEAVEHDETIGWHLEQAHQHLRELGPVDEQGRALGERASRYLAAAGRRALARDDLPLAGSLLGRALDRLDPADAARADLALDWCEALLAAGDVAPAAAAVDELGRFVGESPRLRAWHTCFAGELAVLTDPQALRATADAVAAAAETLAAAGDAAGEAKAHFVHAMALVRVGKIGAGEAALDRALAAARRGRGDRRRANAVLAGAPLAALWGPGPVTRASGRCLDVVRVLRITQGAPAVEAVALRCQGVLEALRGRTEAARRMIASSRRMVEELGLTQGLLETELSAGLVELIEGDDAAAERSLRAAYEGFRDHGLAIDAARAAALLGRTLLPQGRPAEAEALSRESEALAGDDLQAAITWRRVRAEALALRGEHAAAVELARAAVDIAAATDALLHHADARLALAAALRAAGRPAEAAAEEARAIELWEAKGATMLAERAGRGDRRSDPARSVPDVVAVPAPLVRRVVRENAAIAHVRAFEAAYAAGDAGAFVDLIADDATTVDHLTATELDRAQTLRIWRAFLGGDRILVYEPLATLGDAFALLRLTESGSGLIFAPEIDAGAYEAERFVLVEVDAHGRRRRTQLFGPRSLGEAVARLYERYAEQVADRPARVRAAATARSVQAMTGAFDLDVYATALAPGVEFVDRRILGFPAGRGADELLRSIGTLLDTADDVSTRLDDILDLRADAFLVRWTTSGTDRVSRGPFEWQFLRLGIFGADGLLTRVEQFDVGSEAEALVRLEELLQRRARLDAQAPTAGFTAAPPRAAEKLQRRVRANAMTEYVARLDAAMAARDVDALRALSAVQLEVVDHPNGTTYDAAGNLASRLAMLRAQNLYFRHEPLATLGDSLGLFRLSVTASGVAGGKFDVGAYEREVLILGGGDPSDAGGRQWTELFAPDRLGDAIVRLYERYADTLPDGPARVRAAATARSVTAMTGVPELDRLAAAFAPGIEGIDHRVLGTYSASGAQAVLEGYRALFDLSAGIAWVDDTVLGLESDALLVARTHSAIARDGGGAYERLFILLLGFGVDGLITHIEWFDTGRDAQALTRFDELTARKAAPPVAATAPSRAKTRGRRVRPNAVTANAERLDAAMAARDGEALPGLVAKHSEVVEHTTGATYDSAGTLASRLALLRARDLHFRHEPLATLGDSLAVLRLSISASGVAGAKFDVGAYENEVIVLDEGDAYGRSRRAELFAADRLGDAIARLYERYSELLPEGAARTRAAATARSVAAMLGPVDDKLWAPAFAPDVVMADHRILGTVSGRGKDVLLQHIRGWLDVGSEIAHPVDEVLGLASDALLTRRRFAGTDRVGGGAFERLLLQLLVFGADGLIARVETFDTDRTAQALARFDELTTETPQTRLAAARSVATETAARRVRPNAATACTGRMEAVIAARDADAFPALLADELEVVDHTTGVVFDRQGQLGTLRALLKAQNPAVASETLATLGDLLALKREATSASGFVGRTFDVGAYEKKEIVLFEVDAEGRQRRREVFALDRLGDAVVRLYERYAELLPDGPARKRAAATARSVAVYCSGPFDPDRLAAVNAPDIEAVDHRILGHWFAHGAEALLRQNRSWFDVAGEIAVRDEDILALEPGGLLARRTFSGVDRAGGGSFERQFMLLCTFGTDGLVTRTEYFDAGRHSEALARFEELLPAVAGAEPGRVVEGPPAEPPAERFANAAARTYRRVVRFIRERDWESLVALHVSTPVLDDRRRLVRLMVSGEEYFAHLRILCATSWVRWDTELIATRGDRLALLRGRLAGTAPRGVEFVSELIALEETDPDGRLAAGVIFDLDDVEAAYAELESRYAAGEGAPYAALLANLRTAGQSQGDREALARLLPEDFTLMIHRRFAGTGAPLSRAEYLDMMRINTDDLDVRSRIRADHVPRISPTACVTVSTLYGTAAGGAFEIPIVNVFTHDGSRFHAMEAFDPDQLDVALARYEELVHGSREGPTRGAMKTPHIENVATRSAARFNDAWHARDWQRLTAVIAPDFRYVDRRGMLQLDLDPQPFLEFIRPLFDMPSSRLERQVLATRGDRLTLIRLRFEGADHDRGPTETESLMVIEVDAHGEYRALVRFEPDDLDAAYAELDERWAAGEAAPYPLARESGQRMQRAVAARDWELLGSIFAPDFVAEDHRLLGWGTLRSGAEYVAHARALADLRPDVTMRIEHFLALDERGGLVIARWMGGATEGEFEIPVVVLSVVAPAPDWRVRRWDFYDLEQLDAARARFEALGAGAAA